MARLYHQTSIRPVVLANIQASTRGQRGPFQTQRAWLLPPSPTAKRVTSTFVRARIAWLGFSRVPLIRASAVRDGSVPPHMAAFSQAPSPPFHSTVVPAHAAVALATARLTIT